MVWDRHQLLWDGNGTDKYVPRTTLGKPFYRLNASLVLCLRGYATACTKTNICSVYNFLRGNTAKKRFHGAFWPRGRTIV